MNLKDIHIGSLIQSKVQEMQIPMTRMMNFLECSENKILETYLQKSLDTHILLRWSKLLEFDFFRIFTGHLILYAPAANVNRIVNHKNTTLVFRKNIYTQEIKNFILEKINTKVMTTTEVIERYKIPKTTLYKWIKKG